MNKYNIADTFFEDKHHYLFYHPTNFTKPFDPMIHFNWVLSHENETYWFI